jgi:transcriptional regulator with XRE-family HTH domain
MNQLGLRIKKLRTFHCLTQEEVASRLFLSLKAYQNIEHGVTKLDLERIKQLADIFKVDVADLTNSFELKIKFEEPKTGVDHSKVSNGENGFPDLEMYKQLLKEKDNEISFLRKLLIKQSMKKK